jgi:hypothetical protein
MGKRGGTAARHRGGRPVFPNSSLGTRILAVRCPRAPLVAGCLVLLFVTGCAEDNRMAYDPLLGNVPAAPPGPVPAPNGQASAQPANPPAAPAGPLPALAAPNATASNAALAGAPAQSPLEGGSPLRIEDPRSPDANNRTWMGQPIGVPPPDPRSPLPGGSSPPGAQGVPLAPGPAPVQPVSAQAAGSPGSASISSYEQAQVQLAAHGVTWQRLETWGDNGWKFSCSIPNPQNKFISRTYEAQARDYLSAMRAVLDQVSKER